MSRAFITLLLVAVFISPIWAVEWNPVATRVMKSLAYLNGPEGSCTAFVIDSKRDLVLTAGHCDQRTSSGESAVLVDNTPTKVVSKDTKKDLLVLEVKGLDKPALRLAKADPQIGDEVASYGYGLGLERPLFRVAHISDNKLEIPVYTGGQLIAIDAAFVPGQSGGPVVNSEGDVVMIVQASGDGVGVGIGVETIKGKMGRYFERATP